MLQTYNVFFLLQNKKCRIVITKTIVRNHGIQKSMIQLIKKHQF
jgi:hypothetical protein